MQQIQLPVTQVGLEQSIAAAMQKAGRSAQINLGSSARQINAISQPLGRITGQADEFGKSMAAANARVVAFGASVGILGAVSKALKGVVSSAIEVEKSLTAINTILNVTSGELDKFGQKIFDVAKNTGQSFNVVAEAALELSRQGLSAEQTLTRLNDALILTRLSGLDSAKSVEGLTAAFNSFADAGITTEEILNKLVSVSQSFAVSERDLIEGLKRSASVANQAGVSFDELVGIITAVQERTARGGAVIGNSFKTIFARIQDKAVLSDLQDLGVQVTDLQGRVLPATTILQNLSKEMDSLSQVQQVDLAKKLGGVFQLSNLLAALKDLGSEQSKYARAVEISMGASNEAYQKNLALNETLAALINRVSVNAEQLGAKLGEIGVTDSLKNILSFFNGLLEGLQKILGEEGAMSGFLKGLVKGIGNLITGPGLALFGAIILKLSKDLVQFGFASLKSFFGIGKAAKEIKDVESSIQQVLGRNVELQQKLFSLEGNRAAQLKIITDALVQQEALLRRSASISASLAPAVYGVGGRASAEGLRIKSPNAAGGFMPAVAKEAGSIAKGVGGARSGDRPVVIPNFSFGGGKKGTMVAHTGEYIVPNFAGGGSAIFNRDMVKSMGLPSGAQKINAAGGFVPNFLSGPKKALLYRENPSKFAKEYPQEFQLRQQHAASGSKLPYSQWQPKQKSQINKPKALAIDASKFGIIGVSGGGAPRTSSTAIFSKDEKTGLKRAFGLADTKGFSLKFNNIQTQSLDKLSGGISPEEAQTQFREQVNQMFAEPLVRLSQTMFREAFPAEDGEAFMRSIGDSKLVKSRNLFSKSVLGGIFESAIEIAAKATEGFSALPSFDVSDDNRPFDFTESGFLQKPKKQPSNFNQLFFPNNPVLKADAKKTIDDRTARSIIGKALRDEDSLGILRKSAVASAAGGYIPNFASPLQDAISREMSAGVPSSQIYIDKSASLKNALNPMGLMVANRRDEPAGGFQGINRARREGANPMTYGAADGFVPNYAPPTLGVVSAASTGVEMSAESFKAFQQKMEKLAATISDGQIALEQAFLETEGYANRLRQTAEAKKQLADKAKEFLGAYSQGIDAEKMATEAKLEAEKMAEKARQREVEEQERAAQAKRASEIELAATAALKGKSERKTVAALNKIYDEYNKGARTQAELNKAKEKAARVLEKSGIENEQQRASIVGGTAERAAARGRESGGSKDMLGTIFAVQAGLSVLSGMVGETSGKFGMLIKSTVDLSSKITSLIFAQQGLDRLGKSMINSGGAITAGAGKFVQKLGIYGALVGVGFEVFKAGRELYYEFTDANKRAAESSAKLAKAAENAAFKLEDFDPVQQQQLRERSDYLKQELKRRGLNKKDLKVAEEAVDAGVIRFGLSDAKMREFMDQSTTIKSIERTRVGPRAVRAFDLNNFTKQMAEEQEGFTDLRSTLLSGESPQLMRTMRGDPDALNKYLNLLEQNDPEKIRGMSTGAFRALGGKATASIGDIPIDRLKQNLADLKQKQLDDSSKEIAQIKIRLGASLRAIKAEANARELLNKLQKQADKDEIDNLKETNEINRQIYKSELDRSLLLAKQETAEKKRLANLEAQQKVLDKIVKASSDISENSLVESDQKVEIQRITQDFLQRGASNQALIEAVKGGEQEEIVKRARGILGDDLEQINAVEGLLESILIQLNETVGVQKEAQSVAQRTVALEGRRLEVASKDLILATARQRITERAQSNLAAVADDRSMGVLGLDRSSRLLTGQQEIQMARLERSGGMSSSERRAAEQSIVEKYFQLQIQNEEKKAIAQAEIDYIRNSKIEDNITALKENTVALGGVPEDLAEAVVKVLSGGGATISVGGKDRGDVGISYMNPDDQIKIARSLASRNLNSLGVLEEARKQLGDVEGLNEDAIERLAQSIAGLVKTLREARFETDTKQLEQELKNTADAIRSAPESQGAKDYRELDETLRNMRESPSTFRDGMKVAFLESQIELEGFAYKMGKEIPRMLADGLTNAIMSAVDGTTKFKNALRSAAYEFLKAINSQMLNRAAGAVFSSVGRSIGFASGGKVTGGSGSKDDVPAMLMGGEYVINKQSVQKYGPKFLEALNNGTLMGYAKGGKVQKGPQGNFYTPGTFDQGPIVGKRDLLDFATQTGATGKFDRVINEEGFASIALEPESSRLSVSGMRASPMFDATQSAKQDAFNLYLQQYNQEREAKKQAKEQKKVFRRQLLMTAITTVASAGISAGAAGFSAASNAAAGEGFMAQLRAGAKGIFTGGPVSGQNVGNVGGLFNLFSGAGKMLTGNFAEGANLMKLSRIGNTQQLISAMSADKSFADFVGSRGGLSVLRALPVGGSGNAVGAARSGAGVVQQGNIGKGPPLPELMSTPRSPMVERYKQARDTLISVYRNRGVSDERIQFLISGQTLEELHAQIGNLGPAPIIRDLRPAPITRDFATGGQIPQQSGIDTVPAMLSGGEFVMNRAAVQNIGAGNLQSMNSGSTSLLTEESSKELNEKLITKLDELIEVSGSAGEITINVTSSGGNTQETSSGEDAASSKQKLARQIKDAVMQVIEEEKRLGGQLRRR